MTSAHTIEARTCLQTHQHESGRAEISAAAGTEPEAPNPVRMKEPDQLQNLERPRPAGPANSPELRDLL